MSSRTNCGLIGLRQGAPSTAGQQRHVILQQGAGGNRPGASRATTSGTSAPRLRHEQCRSWDREGPFCSRRGTRWHVLSRGDGSDRPPARATSEALVYSPGAVTAFGDLLRRHRTAAGLSQAELAERANLTAKAIGALERGERQHPQPHTVRRLAEALNLASVARAEFLAAATWTAPSSWVNQANW
jgi:DNA-binding XRE family transcriptional regulator